MSPMNPEFSKIINETIDRIDKKQDGSRPLEAATVGKKTVVKETVDVGTWRGEIAKTFNEITKRDSVKEQDAIMIISSICDSMGVDQLGGISRQTIETDNNIIQDVRFLLEQYLNSLRAKKEQIKNIESSDKKDEVIKELMDSVHTEGDKYYKVMKMAVKGAISDMSQSMERKSVAAN
jgi:hypothetical protein